MHVSKEALGHFHSLFLWVVLCVVPHGVVLIDRSKHRYKAELTQMKDLTAFGQRQRLKGDLLIRPLADDAVLLQANQKAQPFFLRNFRLTPHPGCV